MANHWTGSSEAEASMQEGHALLWRRMIEMITEPDLSAMTVLDFGCSQGGMLRQLYKSKPFARGVGFDKEKGSIDDANKNKGELPLEFYAGSDLSRFGQGEFDLVLSHEVIYLLPDLDDHALQIKRVIKAGSAYYAAIGCHEGNPLWPQWRSNPPQHPNLPSYSLQAVAAAFRRANLEVSIRAFRFDDFLPLPADDAWYPGPGEKLEYYYSHKCLFRCVKPAA
jgi:SAM-dependent methyltransferase